MKGVKIWTAIFCLVVIGSTTAYAYASDVFATNNTNVKTWSQQYENIKVLTNNGNAIVDKERGIVFNCSLEEPGDYFEFTVDIVNDGLVDAQIDEIVKTGITDNNRKYLDYNVTYLDGTNIKEKDIIKANDRITIKLNVTYKTDLNAEDLPAEDENAELSFDMTMIERESYR